MAVSNLLAGLVESTLKGKATISKLDSSIRGKIITIYGNNGLGKTKNAVKFPNPVVIPLEKGLNATSGAVVLKTATYTDVKAHVRMLTTNPQWLKALEQEPITLIFDGLENLGLLCQRWLCSKYDVADIAEGKGGYGLWGYYQKEMAALINDIVSHGYTIVFIGHEQESKEGYHSIAGDVRNVKPIRDNSDIVCYLTSNGVDENNQVIPSSAWLAETDQFFARSRFDYMDTYLEVFSAENLIEAIRVGIERQIEAEDAEVGARAHLIHEVGVEVQPQILTLSLADGELPGGAVFVFQRQMAHGVVPVKPVVQHVHHGVAIDGQKLLAGAQTGSHGGAIGIYGGDDGAHRCVLSQKTAYCHIITY